MPVYHRRESVKTQTREDAARQEESGEVWGSAAWYSDIPKVKAFDGPLPDGQRGIEFTTDVEPDSGKSPGQVTWSGKRVGVVEIPGDKPAVKIRVVVTKNTQR